MEHGASQRQRVAVLLFTLVVHLLLFVLLLLIPKRKLVELGQTVKARTTVREPLPMQFRASTAVVVLAAACAVPFVVDEKLVTWNVARSKLQT